MKKKYLFYTGLFLIAYLPVFHQLGKQPFKAWDESLYAMRAYHFSTEHAYLKNFEQYPGITSYPNLKPPLGSFLQAISFELFGYTEWALRMPIALFTMLTVVLIVEMLHQITRSYWPGFLSGIILLSSWGYIREHVVRTGDHDVLILFFLLLQLFAFYFYISKAYQPKHLVLFTLATLGAFFTKGIMAFFLFQAFLVYSIYAREFTKIIRQRLVYLVLAISIFTIVAYYWLMDMLFPGFFDLVWDTVWGRYTGTIENHKLPWYFYLQQFFEKGFFPWCLLLPLAFICKGHKSFIALVVIAIISFALLITLSQTKLYWYDTMLYPLAAILLGVTLTHLKIGKKRISSPDNRPNFMLLTGVTILFLIGYYKVLKTNLNQRWPEEPNQYAYLMKKTSLNSYTVYGYEYNVQAAFYAQLLNEQFDKEISVITYLEQKTHQIGDHILVCDPAKYDRVITSYSIKEVNTDGPCKMVQLIGKKEDGS